MNDRDKIVVLLNPSQAERFHEPIESIVTRLLQWGYRNVELTEITSSWGLRSDVALTPTMSALVYGDIGQIIQKLPPFDKAPTA